ncbi:hypothetical protein KMT30_19955 [Streptomyces sp. IBSBF 2953]|uniref:hypothetical protein n=1 Tax=Streptomyces scabiei TaxID=1930 RepID=UPI00211A4AC4|nr:hypothetical protein [Streptomyces scabiei]MCQ9181277.1 hypothetical protein [Streptomyces hayashii]MDX3114136.1 hypothetical protein [Streptomyces scabiei]
MTATDDSRTLDATISRLGALGPTGVTFWSGAGISRDGPSALPAAAALTERVFDTFFTAHDARSVHSVVMGRHAAVGWRVDPLCDRLPDAAPSIRLPRLETVLGVADRTLGAHRALRILDVMGAVPPNRLHLLFARHLGAGGTHVTANFDDCVERAHVKAYGTQPDPRRLLHFHDSVRDDPDHESLGATLARIEAGFPAEQAAELTGVLKASPAVVVVGYSGSDFFDVDPMLAGLEPGALAGRLVVWVNHEGVRPEHPATHPSARRPAMARLLERAGAEVVVLCGATADVMTRLGHALGLPPLGPTEPGRPAWTDVPVTSRERIAATLALHRALGLVGEVGAMLQDPSVRAACPAADVRRARSEWLWEQGRWRDLRRLWWSAPRPDGVSAAERAERIGACLWVEGRLLPAYLWLRHHRLRAPADEASRLAETEGRALEHLARVPGARGVARVLIRRFLRETADLGVGGDVGLRRKVDDVRSSLTALAAGGPRQGDRAEEDRVWYVETGSVLGSLNYQHRLLRDTYDPALDDGELDRAYRSAAERYASIGSVAGELRTHLLPGAERVFTLGEYLTALGRLQYGPVHRTRLAARFAAVRTVRVLRTAPWRGTRESAPEPGARGQDVTSAAPSAPPNRLR